MTEFDSIQTKNIAMGIVHALALWGDPRYKKYLGRKRYQRLDSEWFRRFVGEWRVARTIQAKKRPIVMDYLNTNLPDALAADRNGGAIDRMATTLKRKGFSAKSGSKRRPVLPISLVSKIAFFFEPSKYTPYDNFGQKGLNTLRGTRKSGGLGHSAYKSYAEYLGDFNGYFSEYDERIRSEISTPWAKGLSQRMSVTAYQTRTIAFRRKVLDNILMGLGGRY